MFYLSENKCCPDWLSVGQVIMKLQLLEVTQGRLFSNRSCRSTENIGLTVGTERHLTETVANQNKVTYRCV